MDGVPLGPGQEFVNGQTMESGEDCREARDSIAGSDAQDRRQCGPA